MTRLEVLSPVTVANPYVAYSYAYPHKSAYGPLKPPVALQPRWQKEKRDALALYLHVPFCAVRCGFCNLFARAQADRELIDSYLHTVEHQAGAVADALGDFTFVRFALGGGTPTFLAPEQLEAVFDLAQRVFRVDPAQVPVSVETSPGTATSPRLAVLRARGVQRVSMGVQSFDEAEVRAIGRPQSAAEVHAALERLQQFPILNIDLIYGQPTQTVPGWLRSVQTALQYDPEEIFLYPLYVRPQTGIGKQKRVQRTDGDLTRQMYREARALLLTAGYTQISMRCFQKEAALSATGPDYCCQTDGMVGLGCGARSYTSRLHYSSRFAVASAQVHAILAEWIAQPRSAFTHARWGVWLSEEERKRRFVIQSLLTRTGVNEMQYTHLFGEPLASRFSEFTWWREQGLVQEAEGYWRLTAAGMELSDVLGPALYSEAHWPALEAFATP